MEKLCTELCTSFDSEDEILKQLIETNIRQRGIGNANAVKLGRCIKELERIYGIKNGGDRKSDGNNCNLKTQSDLAEEFEMSKRQMANYKSLTDLIPELQDAVQSGKVTATTAMGFVKKLSSEEQKKLAEAISGKDKVSGKEVEAEIARLATQINLYPTHAICFRADHAFLQCLSFSQIGRERSTDCQEVHQGIVPCIRPILHCQIQTKAVCHAVIIAMLIVARLFPQRH